MLTPTSILLTISSWSWLILAAICLSATLAMHAKRLKPHRQHENQIVYPEPESRGGQLDEPAPEYEISQRIEDPKRNEEYSKESPKNGKEVSRDASLLFFFVFSVMTLVIVISGGGALYLSIIHDNLETHQVTLNMFDNGWKSGIAAISGLVAGRKL